MSDPPNESEAAFLKAIGDRSEHETAEAERELRVFLARRPDSFEGQLLLGWICFRRSGFEDMVAALSRAVTLDSTSAQAWSYLGTGYFYQGRLSDAVEAFNAALAVKESPSELTRLGCCLHRLGRTEEAIAAYRRALRLLPAAGRRHGSYLNYWLMRALREVGRLKEADEAVRQIQHILAARPNAGASTMVVHLNQMDYQEWDRFRKKEELHAAIGNYRRARGEGAFPFYPASFSMPEDEATLRQAAVERGGEAIWIVKPTYLFGGQGMRLVQGLNDVPREAGHIVQAYIDRPYLVQGKKSHIRLYLLITSVEPLRAYLWRNGIVRFAPEPYRPAPGWLDRTAIHITNTALHKGHPDLVLSDDPARDDYGNVWSLTALLRHIEAQGIDAETLWPRLESLVLAFARVVEHSGLFRRQAEQPGREAYPPKLVGLDVLLDAELRPWLLEAQRTPGQTGSVIVESVNAALFRTIAAMSAFTLLDAERPDPGGPSDIKDRSARERLESEIEYARRGDFVRLIPPDPAASEASSTQVGL